jgi:hypothetical protein
MQLNSHLYIKTHLLIQFFPIITYSHSSIIFSLGQILRLILSCHIFIYLIFFLSIQPSHSRLITLHQHICSPNKANFIFLHQTNFWPNSLIMLPMMNSLISSSQVIIINRYNNTFLTQFHKQFKLTHPKKLFWSNLMI